MEVCNAKQGMYPLSFFVTLMLLNAYCYGAAVLIKSNVTFPCDGRLGDCLIEEDLEMEFLIYPYVSRILQHSLSEYPVYQALDAEHAVPCGEKDDPRPWCHGGKKHYPHKPDGGEKIYGPKSYSAGCNIYARQCPE